MMCCSLTSLGFDTPFKRNLVQATGTGTVLAAVAGVVTGVLALYGVISTSTALWTQVGLLGGVAILAGVTVGMSKRIESKLPIIMALVTALTLPVLFGSLGAVKIIPPYHMLWASTMICSGIVVAGFASSMGSIVGECCKKKPILNEVK